MSNISKALNKDLKKLKKPMSEIEKRISTIKDNLSGRGERNRQSILQELEEFYKSYKAYYGSAKFVDIKDIEW